MNLLAAGRTHPQVDKLRAQMVEMSQACGDPVQNCVAKWFGQWQGLSGQPDVSSAYEVMHEGRT